MKRTPATKTLLWLAVAVIVSIMFFAFGSREPGHATLIDRSLSRLVYPIEKGVTSVVDGVVYVGRRYMFLTRTEADNEKLRQKVADYKMENRRLKEALQGLSDLLPAREYAESLKYETVTARIIAASFDTGNRVVTINKGTADGIKADMGVMTPDGVVGIVMRVFNGAAIVRLLTDPRAAVDGLLPGSRVRGIVRGINDPSQLRCTFTFVEHSEGITDGGKLVTSGLDQRFPAAVPLGVVRVPPGADPQTVDAFVVEPAVDFQALQHVLVITGGNW